MPRAREAHDLGDQQEVVGEAEPVDDRELLRKSRRGGVVGRAVAAPQPLVREAPQLERPGLPRRQRGARKDRRAELEFEPAARGDLAVVGQRLSRRLGDPRPVAGRAHPPLPLRRAGEPRLARAERLTRHALEQLAGRSGDRDAVGLVVARMEQRGVAGRH